MTYFRIVFFIGLSFFLHPLFAQTKQGGIYNLYFQVQDSLTKGAAPMEQELLDSIKQLTENKLSEILDAEIRCIYKLKKNGKPVSTAGVFGVLESMPTNTFKNTRKNYDKDFYIQLTGHLDATGGSPIVLRSGGLSKIKPVVTITVHVYDRDKHLVWKRNCCRGDFGDLRNEVKIQRKEGIVWKLLSKRDRNPDRLEPQEILYMYMQTLEEL